MSKVIIGKFGKTFGVHGWIKVHSFADPPESIIHFSPWFISADEKNWQEITEYEGQQKGHNIIVQLPNITSPEQAKIYTNQLIAIERTQLPTPVQNEFYWVDLVGCEVVNTKNIDFGCVDYLFATVSNDVMVVKKNQRERLIPFLKHVIIKVDLAAKKIIVDWDEDF